MFCNISIVSRQKRGVPHSPKESGGNHFRRLFRLFGHFSYFVYFLGICQSQNLSQSKDFSVTCPFNAKIQVMSKQNLLCWVMKLKLLFAEAAAGPAAALHQQ